MNVANTSLSHQAQRLLQLGVAFILYSSFAGFAIPIPASSRIGLSVHTLSALQGIFLLAVGLLWPKLRLGIAASWAAFWLFIYGAASILAAYTIAAIWGSVTRPSCWRASCHMGFPAGLRSKRPLSK